MPDGPITTRILDDFDDPALTPAVWDALLASGPTKVPALTRVWQELWWNWFRGERLLLILVEHEGQPVAIAPTYVDSGMAYLVGSGGSDYLDFVGDVTIPGVVPAILASVMKAQPQLLGFQFFHVPDESPTGPLLAAAATGLGLACFDEGAHPAPAIDLAGHPDRVREAIGKKSLVRHERLLRRDGALEVHHFSDGELIIPQLEAFFDQHVARRAATPHPSRFRDPTNRRFVEHSTRLTAHTGWLRFTRVDWQGRPIAIHYGTCFHGTYVWGTPTFDIALARYSPGEVLLRQLLVAAVDEGAHTFDFGLGDEPFKLRFATHVKQVRTWGLYPLQGRAHE